MSAEMIAADLFAGLGGWSTGAEQAGASVVWAANHWDVAVAYHRQNHPRTKTDCCDLRVVDWTRVPRCDLLLASPSCVGHSQARGVERPHHDAHRATAWVVVEALEQLRPDWFAVENVVAMRRWPLYPVWRLALTTLGYCAEEHVLDAADSSPSGCRWIGCQSPRRLCCHRAFCSDRPGFPVTSVPEYP